MADTWYEYVQGSPEQRLADLEKQRKEFDALKSDPRWGSLSPRQKMLASGDTLYPTRTTDAAEDLSDAANYALDVGVRPRDTAIRAVQELAAGDPVHAAGLALAAVPSAVVPSLAAGTPGSEDDWRKHGNPAVAFGLDMLTDPANYAGVGLIGRGLKKVAAGAGDAADTIRKLRYSTDLSGIPAWAADDIAAGLPRAAPESAVEAMILARRGADPSTTPLPHEWARQEAERYGKGYHYETRMRGIPTTVPNVYGDIPSAAGGVAEYLSIPPRGGVKRYGVRVPNEPIRPYPHDADVARQERRLANARAILEAGRQNPEILQQLPAVFRAPLSDDLIARLAAEAQNPLTPIVNGAALGAGATLGGGLAYGLLGEE
jgi:hypothetical protein